MVRYPFTIIAWAWVCYLARHSSRSHLTRGFVTSYRGFVISYTAWRCSFVPQLCPNLVQRRCVPPIIYAPTGFATTVPQLCPNSNCAPSNFIIMPQLAVPESFQFCAPIVLQVQLCPARLPNCRIEVFQITPDQDAWFGVLVRVRERDWIWNQGTRAVKGCHGPAHWWVT